MGGTIVAAPPAPHVCEGRPNPNLYRAATQWKCDDCPQTWVVVEGNQYNESYKAWRRLTLRNVSGRDEF